MLKKFSVTTILVGAWALTAWAWPQSAIDVIAVPELSANEAAMPQLQCAAVATPEVITALAASPEPTTDPLNPSDPSNPSHPSDLVSAASPIATPSPTASPTAIASPIAPPAASPVSLPIASLPAPAPISTSIPASNPTTSVTAAGVVISFKPSTVLRGAEYTVADVATVKCADAARSTQVGALLLGKTPKAGIRQMLNAVQIRGQLAQMGLTEPEVALQFPRQSFLEREVQTVDMKMLKDEIQKQILAQVSPAGEGNVMLEHIQLPQSLVMAAGELTIQVSEIKPPRQMTGSVPFTADLLVDGANEKKLTGVAQLDMEVEVMQSSKGVARGGMVDPAGCSAVKRRLSQVQPGSLRPQDIQMALMAKRDVNPGDVLNWGNVGKETLVRRGQTVRMMLRKSGMQISAEATARSDGALGDRIEVLNPSSGKRLEAIVTGRQFVQVPF